MCDSWITEAIAEQQQQTYVRTVFIIVPIKASSKDQATNYALPPVPPGNQLDYPALDHFLNFSHLAVPSRKQSKDTLAIPYTAQKPFEIPPSKKSYHMFSQILIENHIRIRDYV